MSPLTSRECADPEASPRCFDCRSRCSLPALSITACGARLHRPQHPHSRPLKQPAAGASRSRRRPAPHPRRPLSRSRRRPAQESTGEAAPRKIAAMPRSSASRRCRRISSCPVAVEGRRELHAARSGAAHERGAGQGRSGRSVLVRLRLIATRSSRSSPSWEKNKPEYIEFVRVPVMWGPVHRAHARLFYTLQALGRSDLHQKVFDAIHKQAQHAASRTTSRRRASCSSTSLKANGISAEDFNKAWDSFTVSSGLQRAEQLTQRYQVDGVPLRRRQRQVHHGRRPRPAARAQLLAAHQRSRGEREAPLIGGAAVMQGAARLIGPAAC